MSRKFKTGGHHNPFRGFMDVMSEMNRAQSQWMLSGKAEASEGGRSVAAAYVPPADIYALGDDLIVRCEVPGVRREDIALTVSGGLLTISGYRDSELNESQAVYYTRERVYGSFSRNMILPESVDESALSATFRNGLLEVTIKNGAATNPHSVNIVDEGDD